jgi:uncharacterized NAD(P)/FAD-binding protein YdhS
MLADLSTLQNDGHGSGQRMSGSRHVIIVGGGASGVLLACHLLRRFSDNFKVTLIEKHSAIGRGLAYGTVDPAHLLNVRAANMSAFADDPDHFWQWLLANNLTAADSDQSSFVSRQLYGRYIESLLQGLTYGHNRELDIVRAECVAIAPTPSGAIARLADGSSISAQLVVLATGNETCQAQPSNLSYASPWQVRAESSIPRDGHVVMVGAGLTMIDTVQSLLHGGHEGPITAISRHGLLPRPHRPVAPFPIDRAEIPFGADIAELVGWLRQLVRTAEQRGGCWRGVVDGMRPFTQELWQSLSIAARRRFLRHARTWWDVHRHRMAPEVEDVIGRAIASGQLKIRAAKVQSIKRDGGAVCVTFRPRGGSASETTSAVRIVDCVGVNPIPHNTSNPVLRSLFDSGLARVDRLGIGLDSTDDCALVGQSGEPSRRIFAIGPLTRAAFWEIIAIPDIRAQCHRLTAHLSTVLQRA